MAVFDRNGDGKVSGMETGRTVAEAGLWLDTLGKQRRGDSRGPGGGQKPGCSCSGCLIAIVAVVVLILVFSFAVN